jgi:MYXO-CTERM domain-containing protein
MNGCVRECAVVRGARAAVLAAVFATGLLPSGAAGQAPAWHVLEMDGPVHDIGILEATGEGWAVIFEDNQLRIHPFSFPRRSMPTLEVAETMASATAPRLAISGDYALIATGDGLLRWNQGLQTWEAKSIAGIQGGMADVRIDPVDPQLAVAVSRLGLFYPQAALSMDGGMTWEAETVTESTESMTVAAVYDGRITLFDATFRAPWVRSTPEGEWMQLDGESAILVHDATTLADGRVVGVGFESDYGVGSVGGTFDVRLGTTGDPSFVRIAGEDAVYILVDDTEIFRVADPATPELTPGLRDTLPATDLLESYALGAWSEGRLVVTGRDAAGNQVILWRNRPPLVHLDLDEAWLLEGDPEGAVVAAAIDPDGDALSLVDAVCEIPEGGGRNVVVDAYPFGEADELFVRIRLSDRDSQICPGAEGWALSCALTAGDGEHVTEVEVAGRVVSPPPSIDALLPALQTVESGDEVEVEIAGLLGCRIQSVTAIVQDEPSIAVEVVDGSVRFTPILRADDAPAELTVVVTARDEDGREVQASATVMVNPPPLPAVTLDCPAELVAGLSHDFVAVDASPENPVVDHLWSVSLDSGEVGGVASGTHNERYAVAPALCAYGGEATVSVTPIDGDGVEGEPQTCVVPVVSQGLPQVDAVSVAPEPDAYQGAIYVDQAIRITAELSGFCGERLIFRLADEPPLAEVESPAAVQDVLLDPHGVPAGTHDLEVVVLDGKGWEHVFRRPLVVHGLPIVTITSCISEMFSDAPHTFHAEPAAGSGEIVGHAWTLTPGEGRVWEGTVGATDGPSFEITPDPCDHGQTLEVRVTPSGPGGRPGDPVDCFVDVLPTEATGVSEVAIAPEVVMLGDSVTFTPIFTGICLASWRVKVGEDVVHDGPIGDAEAIFDTSGLSPGLYDVEVTVTDGPGNTGEPWVGSIEVHGHPVLAEVVCDPARPSDETHTFDAVDESGTITGYAWTVSLGGEPWAHEGGGDPGPTYQATSEVCDHGKDVVVSVAPIGADGNPGAEVGCTFPLQPRVATAVEALGIAFDEAVVWPGEAVAVTAGIAGVCVNAVTVEVVDSAEGVQVNQSPSIPPEGGSLDTTFDAPTPPGPSGTYEVRVRVQAGAADAFQEFVSLVVHRPPAVILDCPADPPEAGSVVTGMAVPATGSGEVVGHEWEVRLDDAGIAQSGAEYTVVLDACVDAGALLQIAVTPIGAGGRAGDAVACMPMTIGTPAVPQATIGAVAPARIWAGEGVTVAVETFAACERSRWIEVRDGEGAVVSALDVDWPDPVTAVFEAPPVRVGEDASTYALVLFVDDGTGQSDEAIADLVVHALPALAACTPDPEAPFGYVAVDAAGEILAYDWRVVAGERIFDERTDPPALIVTPDRCDHGEVLSVSVRPVGLDERRGEAVDCGDPVVIPHDGAPPALIVEAGAPSLLLDAEGGRSTLAATVADCPDDEVTITWRLVDPPAGVVLEGSGGAGAEAIERGLPGTFSIDVVVEAEAVAALVGADVVVEVFAETAHGAPSAPEWIVLGLERGDPPIRIVIDLDAPAAREAAPGDLVVVAGRITADTPFVLPEVAIDLEGGLEVVPGSVRFAEDCTPWSPDAGLPSANGSVPTGRGSTLHVDGLGRECRGFSLLARRGFGAPELSVTGCTWSEGDGVMRTMDCTGGIAARVDRLPGFGCAAAPGDGPAAAGLFAVLLALAAASRRRRRPSASR